MKTNQLLTTSAATLVGICLFACSSPAIAVPPPPGFGSLDYATPYPFNAFEDSDATVTPSHAKLFGGANTTIGGTSLYHEWMIDLAQPAQSGHSIYGDFDYFHPNATDTNQAALYIDPDGAGSALAQLIATSTTSNSGAISGLIPSIALPVGAVEVLVRLEVTGNPPTLKVPNNSIDLFYVVPEPSSFALAAMSVVGLAAIKRRRRSLKNLRSRI